ncbi:MAG: cation transporter [Actinobacteria bacterium]|nr:cation transporter [Actinomycetota bacterium]
MPTTRTYDVPTISCGHCKATIESTLGERDDVETVDVDIDSRTVRVTGDVTEDDVRSSLDEAGYEVAGTA